MTIDIVGDIDDYALGRFYQNVESQLDNIGEELKIRINSVGGYVDVAEDMCDAIIEVSKQYNLPINTENTGDCMSAATLIFLLGENRKWDASKGDFLIHNPWCINVGDANSMRKCAKSLQEMEDYFKQVYSSATGMTYEELTAIMDTDKPMKEEDMIKYGFSN